MINGVELGTASGTARPPNGSHSLPRVEVDSYNAELRDRDGSFIGDRASNRAFHAIIEDWRDCLQQATGPTSDPLGERSSHDIGRRGLDQILHGSDLEAAGLVLGAIEHFARDFTGVVCRFLRHEGWEGTQRIVVGGGLLETRLGQLAVGRAGVLLKARGVDLPLVPIRHHPDEAGLIGAAHLISREVLDGYDGFAAVDIGGTNIRAGIIAGHGGQARDFSRAAVWRSTRWQYREDGSPSRDAAAERVIGLLLELIAQAESEGLTIAPYVGLGCPGMIAADGTIERGGQNLPGNWECDHFNLPARIQQVLPAIGGRPAVVLMHNDAVVQGLSQLPFMQDVDRWGILTIGTGLGNARFTNRRPSGA